MVMTYSQAKVLGQWSVFSQDRVETNERCTEAIALSAALMQLVNMSLRYTLHCVLITSVVSECSELLFAGWSDLHLWQSRVADGSVWSETQRR